jgi:hypothetical protein
VESLSIEFNDQAEATAAPAQAVPDLNINFAQPKQQPAETIYDAFVSGLEGSSSGLMYNKRLPDIVLDEHHSTWLQRRAADAGGIVGDLPEMVAGGVVGMAGGPIAAGASAFALPTAIRTAYTEAYKNGDINSVGDFLARSGVVIKETGKAAVIGAAGAATGGAASALAAKYGLGGVSTLASTIAAEAGAFTVAPAALERRLPTLEDFGNAAVMVAGFRAAHMATTTGFKAVSDRIANTFASTGSTPFDVVKDARNDPQIGEDLGVPKNITPQMEAWRETSKTSVSPDGVVNSIDLAGKIKTDLGEDHFVSAILDKMMPRLKGFNVEVVPDSEWQFRKYNDNRVAQYNEKTNSLQFRGSIQLEPAVHEILHEGTARELQLNPAFNQDVTAIMGRVRDAIEGGDVEKVPASDMRRMKAALKNPAEFVAYGLSSPQVINVLRGVRGVGRSPTMFTTFVQTVAKAFGFQAKEYSALHDLVNAVEYGMDTSPEYKGGTVKQFIREQKAKMAAPPATEVVGSVEAVPGAPALAEAAPVAPAALESVTLSKKQIAHIDDQFSQANQVIADLGKDLADAQAAMAGKVDAAPYEQKLVEAASKIESVTAELEKAKGASEQFKAEREDLLNRLAERDRQIEELKAGKEPTERAIPRAYEQMAADEAAAEAFPGVKAQQVIDSPFAEIPDMKLPYQMNLRYVESSDAVKALITRISDVYQDDINAQRNGTVSWADQEAKLREEGRDIFGDDFEKLSGRKGGDAVSSLEIKARIDLWKRATLEASQALSALKKAGLDATEGMKLAAHEAIQRQALIHSELIGAASEAARAIQLMKQIKAVQMGADFTKLADMIGKNPDDLLNLAMQAETPEQLGKIIQEANKPTKYQKFMELQRAFLTSGIRTHEANVIGNLLFGGMRPLVDAASVPIGMALRNADRTQMAEPLAKVLGMAKGTVDGARFAWHVLKTGEPVGNKVENNRNAIGGLFGEAVRLNFRVLGAEDAFFKTSLERGELNSMAVHQAVKEGLDPRTDAFTKRVSDLTENPPADMLEAAQNYGKRFTFNEDMGKKGRALQNFLREWKMDWIVPFTGTPLNVFEQMIRHSPGAPVLESWRADIAKGGQARDKALAEVAVGSSVMLTGFLMASGGYLTSAGDPDPKKRATQFGTGWQPYSIKVNDKYYPINRFAPVSTLMTMAADIHDAWGYMEDGEKDKAIKASFIAFSNAVTNQTFVAGMAKFLAAFTDPYNRGERWFESLAGSMVPGVVSQFSNDPYQREVYSVLDAVRARIPGMSEDLQPKRDMFGEEIKAKDRWWVVDATEQTTDKVRLEAERLGIGISQAPKSIQVKSKGHRELGKLELSPEQRDIFAETKGKEAHKIMERYVDSPTWDFLPKDTKEKLFQHAFEIAAKKANRAAVTNEQRREKQQAIHEELRRRMVPETPPNLP